MPRYEKIRIDLINEPANPARFRMDQEKFDALKRSIANPRIGQLQAIIVFPVEGDRFEIEDGHRRFLAMREIHCAAIDCKVYESEELAKDAVKLQANLHEEMSAAEEAAYYCALIDEGKSFDEVCEIAAQKQNYVSDRVNLLRRGDAEIFKSLANGEIKFGVARELNKITNEALRRYYLQWAIANGCNYKTAQLWVQHANLQNAGAAPAPEQPPAEVPPAELDKTCCAMCGGDKDPYNLRWKQLHYYCWERVEKALRGEV